MEKLNDTSGGRVSLPKVENPFEAEHNRLIQEVAVLKSLLTRAADALEDLVWKERLHQQLIADLRKAAE